MIRFNRNHAHRGIAYQPGQEVTLDPECEARLVAKGVASYVAPADELPTPEQAPPKRRGRKPKTQQ